MHPCVKPMLCTGALYIAYLILTILRIAIMDHFGTEKHHTARNMYDEMKDKHP
jgi:hypothetical protein